MKHLLAGVEVVVVIGEAEVAVDKGTILTVEEAVVEAGGIQGIKPSQDLIPGGP